MSIGRPGFRFSAYPCRVGVLWWQGRWIRSLDVRPFVSSPEPKAQVSYCHSAPSVVRPSVHKLLHFQLLLQNSLDGFWWNLVGMKYSWSLTSVVVFRPDLPQVVSKKILLQTRRLQRQTKWIAMIKKHVGRSVVIFGSIPRSNFRRVFDVFLDLVIFAYFIAT